ncbi:MAG: hypothetical protein ACFFDR_13390, partial [Candidatus Thorarchaeota archaeon]
MSGAGSPTPPDTREDAPELMPAAPLEQLNYYLTGGTSGISLLERISTFVKTRLIILVFLILILVGGGTVFIVYGINAMLQFVVVIGVIYVFRNSIVKGGRTLKNFILHPSEGTKSIGPSFWGGVAKLRQEM